MWKAKRKKKVEKEEIPEVIAGEQHDTHCGMTKPHLDEVVKFIQYGERKIHLIIKEEGEIGQEYLRVEMRRTREMKDACNMNKRVVSTLTSLVNDGDISAIVINKNDFAQEE